MPKARHLDFELKRDEDSILKFRFYPKSSHMHGFDEEPPKTFDDVYKVYYTWGIFRSQNLACPDEPDEWTAFQRMFHIAYDECSALETLEYGIRHVIRYKKGRLDHWSWGEPGSDWIISYRKEDKQDRTKDRVFFEVFDNSTDAGFRFVLSVDKALAFADYLHTVNQHMLENGEPI